MLLLLYKDFYFGGYKSANIGARKSTVNAERPFLHSKKSYKDFLGCNKLQRMEIHGFSASLTSASEQHHQAQL